MTIADTLLRTDFDGQPVHDLNDFVLDALEDPRRLDRVPGLTALLADDAAAPLDRLWACIALTSWGEPAGFAAVERATQAPDDVPWRGVSIDRWFSQDNTFGLLAAAVSTSRIAPAPEPAETQSLSALRALVGVADQVNFDGQLEWALDRRALPLLAGDLAAVVRRGLLRLRTEPAPPYDLPTQLVDLLIPLAREDDALAGDLALELVSEFPSGRTLRHAVDVVGAGTGPATVTLGEYLGAVGGPAITEQVARALAGR